MREKIPPHKPQKRFNRVLPVINQPSNYSMNIKPEDVGRQQQQPKLKKMCSVCDRNHKHLKR